VKSFFYSANEKHGSSSCSKNTIRKEKKKQVKNSQWEKRKKKRINYLWEELNCNMWMTFETKYMENGKSKLWSFKFPRPDNKNIIANTAVTR